MFYIWHTLLVTAFIGIAYYLGYQFSLKKKIKVASQKKLWKVLKSTPKEEVEVAVSTVSPNDTSQEDWIKGYNKWQKTNQKLNDLTQK
jgi:hypothetical protein